MLRILITAFVISICLTNSDKAWSSDDLPVNNTCFSNVTESSTNDTPALTEPEQASTKSLKPECQNENEKIDANPLQVAGDVSNSTGDVTSVERKNEEQRLKVLFVDVNSVMESVGHSMDWTANWLDGYFANGEKGRDKAKAWGHIVMGWEPRDGEWGNFPIKFKVRAKLPNLKNRVELILTDSEQDDFKNLPYESVRPDAYKSSQRSLGAAVRFLHTSSENVSSSSRLGWGESQVYARSQVTYRKKYLKDKVTFSIQPSLEYYVSDGWGSRILIDTGLEIDKGHELRLNYSIRDLETYDAPEWRTGLYSISAVNDTSAVIMGLSSIGVVKPSYVPEFYKFSVRYRKKAIRSWIFLEVEPFIEFQRELNTEFPQINGPYTEFVRDIGITFRFEAHYGFL